MKIVYKGTCYLENARRYLRASSFSSYGAEAPGRTSGGTRRCPVSTNKKLLALPWHFHSILSGRLLHSNQLIESFGKHKNKSAWWAGMHAVSLTVMEKKKAKSPYYLNF